MTRNTIYLQYIIDHVAIDVKNYTAHYQVSDATKDPTPFDGSWRVPFRLLAIPKESIGAPSIVTRLASSVASSLRSCVCTPFVVLLKNLTRYL